MKFFWVKSFIFAFFLQCYIINADPITVGVIVQKAVMAKDVFLLVKNAVIAHSESGNWKQFFENLDPVVRRQMHLEFKLNEIQNAIKDLTRKIDNLDFSVGTKYFNTEIKHPAQHVFFAVQNFLEDPSTDTKDRLSHQCKTHPPNNLLLILKSILNEDWLVEQSRHYKYESPALAHLIKKLDRLVQTLAICEAACSGLHNSENAEKGLKRIPSIFFKRCAPAKNHNCFFVSYVFKHA